MRRFFAGLAKALATMLCFALIMCAALFVLRESGALPVGLLPRIGEAALPAAHSVGTLPSAQAGDVTKAAKAKAGVYAYRSQRGDYDALPNDDCRALYDAMLEAATQMSDTPDDRGLYPMAQAVGNGARLSAGDIRQVVMALRNDNPQFFWISNTYSYTYRMQGTVVEMCSNLSSTRRVEEEQVLNAAIAQIIGTLPAGISEERREELLFNALVQKCSYDTAVGDSDWQSYNAYGAIINGKAVCEGYSRAMQLLCSYADMSCRLANGKLENASHMWNLLSVGGAWYHLDVTSCDSGTVLSYAYYNLTDKVLSNTHDISPDVRTLSADTLTGGAGGPDFNFSLPACTATAANYFLSRGIRVGGFSGDDDKAVIAALAKAALSGTTEVALYIAPGLDYDKTVEALFQKAPYKLQYYISQVNGQAARQVDYGKLSYITAKHARGITLQLGYQ